MSKYELDPDRYLDRVYDRRIDCPHKLTTGDCGYYPKQRCWLIRRCPINEDYDSVDTDADDDNYIGWQGSNE